MSPSEIEISVDGVSKKVEAGLKVTQVLEQIYPERMKPGVDAIIVCKINGELKDLWSDISQGDVIESIAISTDEGLSVLRHSTAHVLAQAVQDVFPETKLGIGPPIKDGFYYDFDPKSPFTPDDLIKLESAMK
ncbi:MAG: threonine--tRNA ligase, partial [Candidatus Nanopelagicaceae bacterium]